MKKQISILVKRRDGVLQTVKAIVRDPMDQTGKATYTMTMSAVNDKVSPDGAVLSWSLPPIATCRPGVPCMGKCYAVAMLRGPHGKAIGLSWHRNMVAVRTLPQDLLRLALAGMIRASGCRYVRVHVSGDFNLSPGDQSAMDRYVYLWRQVAADLPSIRFMAYTKVEAAGSCVWPINWSMLWSAWTGTVLPPRPDVTIAMSGPITAAPVDALICPDDCAACGHSCWFLADVTWHRVAAGRGPAVVFFPFHGPGTRSRRTRSTLTRTRTPST